jgi:hypothetical protein
VLWHIRHSTASWRGPFYIMDGKCYVVEDTVLCDTEGGVVSWGAQSSVFESRVLCRVKKEVQIAGSWQVELVSHVKRCCGSEQW